MKPTVDSIAAKLCLVGIDKDKIGTGNFHVAYPENENQDTYNIQIIHDINNETIVECIDGVNTVVFQNKNLLVIRRYGITELYSPYFNGNILRKYTSANVIIPFSGEIVKESKQIDFDNIQAVLVKTSQFILLANCYGDVIKLKGYKHKASWSLEYNRETKIYTLIKTNYYKNKTVNLRILATDAKFSNIKVLTTPEDLK